MQFDEEKVNQSELEDTPEENEEEVSESDEEDLGDIEEEIEADKPEPTVVVRKPRTTGLWLTAFAAVVIILIGGLASYYYYTFQSQGAVGEQQVRDIWEDTANATQDLVDSFNHVTKLEDLKDRSAQSFSVAVDAASRTVRDAGFDLQNQPGLNLQASTVVSKFAAFAEDYGAYIAEMRRVVDRVDEVESADDLKQLQDLGQTAETAYDDLLSVNKGFLKGSLPRTVFDIGDKVAEYAKSALGENSDKEQATKAAQTKAQGVINRFAQAWQDKDSEAMGSLMTVGGKSEFDESMLEDETKVVGLTIDSTVLAEDGSKVTIRATVKKQKDEEDAVNESWQFVLLPSGDLWLIDSFKKV